MMVPDEVERTSVSATKSEAMSKMPFTALSREECRLVRCPECGAEVTYKCVFPLVSDASKFRPKERIHKKRIDRAQEYRAEHRI